MSNILEDIEKRKGRPLLNREPQRTEQRVDVSRLQDWDDDDKLKIYSDEIPNGMSYEWKRVSIRGMDDKSHQANLISRGFWSPVPGNRLPRFGISGDAPIVVDDLMLMERPIEYTEERHKQAETKAKHLVSSKMNELGMAKGGNQFDRTAPKVKRTMEIPD